MKDQDDGFDAPISRWWSWVAVIVIGVLAMGISPALADPTDCVRAADRLTRWATREASQGLSPDLLEDLQELKPLLTRCAGLAARPEPEGGSGDTALNGMGDDVDRWRPLAALYFTAEELERVLCLMTAESGGNLHARNPSSGASGLMQVMPSWAGVFGYSRRDLFQPDINLWVASQILDRQGWGAWTPYLRGACRG